MYALSNSAPLSPDRCVAAAFCSSLTSVGSVSPFVVASCLSSSFAFVWSVTMRCANAFTSAFDAFCSPRLPAFTSAIPACAASLAKVLSASGTLAVAGTGVVAVDAAAVSDPVSVTSALVVEVWSVSWRHAPTISARIAIVIQKARRIAVPPLRETQVHRQCLSKTLIVVERVVELRGDANETFRRVRRRHERDFDSVLEQQRVLQRIGDAVRQRHARHRAEHLVRRGMRDAE